MWIDHFKSGSGEGESSFSPSRGSTWTFNMESQLAKVLELYLLGQYMTLTSLKMNAIMEMSYNGWHPVWLCGCYPTLQQYAYFKTSLHWSCFARILVWKKGCVYLTVGKIVQRLTLVKNNNCYHLGWTNKWEHWVMLWKRKTAKCSIQITNGRSFPLFWPEDVRNSFLLAAGDKTSKGITTWMTQSFMKSVELE